MRTPSGRMRQQTVTLYLNTWKVDGEAGPVVDSTTQVTGVVCSIFPGDSSLERNESGRWTSSNVYELHFNSDPGLKSLDQIQWVDGTLPHNVTVYSSANNRSGRSASFVVQGVEVV